MPDSMSDGMECFNTEAQRQKGLKIQVPLSSQSILHFHPEDCWEISPRYIKIKPAFIL
jgi:hypothetical protein